MNAQLLLNLIALRYKLMWAKVRSRNGRIALFLSGYLLLVFVIALLAAGGFGAAILAVRSGQAEFVAQAVFGGLFVQAIISSSILGFGVNAIFVESELRRYPLSALDRLIARHAIGILDPFWLLFLCLELGLALGLYALGAAGLFTAFAAVFLLSICTYLAARVVASSIDRLMQRRGGPMIVIGVIMALAFLPGPAAEYIKQHPDIWTRVLPALATLPPFLAAAAVAGATAKLAALLLWIVGLAAVLIYVDQRPAQRQAAVSTKIVWETPFDRIGGIFGPRLGPLVAHWLAFYCRNTRTRTMLIISIPLMSFLVYSTSQRRGPSAIFAAALGLLPMATFFVTARFSVNQFGYSAGGFRRYFLLPIPPGDTLRAASYAAVLMGGAVIPLALIVWIALAPVPFDARQILMLACTGLTGLLTLNATGLWVTLFNPRKGDYTSNFGNDLPLGGNIILIGGMITAIALPQLLAKFVPAAVAPASWWAFPVLPIVAVTYYLTTLRLAGPIVERRREILLSIVEGRA